MAQRKSSARLWGNSAYRNHPDDGSPSVRSAPTGADLVDTEDPAYGHIVRAAMQLIQFGFEPGDPDIARRAIEAGRREYEREPQIRAAQEREEAQRRKADPFLLRDGEVVYYMRIGNRVKIGTSANLPLRLASINPEELMVTEPGNRTLERVRHDQFKDLRSHGEWFRLEDPLTGHIAWLQAAAERVELTKPGGP